MLIIAVYETIITFCSQNALRTNLQRSEILYTHKLRCKKATICNIKGNKMKTLHTAEPMLLNKK